MPAWILLLSSFAVLPAPSDELLDATLWMQHAAERQAVCRQAYTWAEERLHEALADPGWSALPAQQGLPAEQLAGLPAAVILDVDETVLDNHWYEARLVQEGRRYDRESWAAWCAERAATPVPGALDFCRAAARAGVTVFYVTNRREDEAADTLANLEALGFPLGPGRGRLLPRGETSDKTARRADVAAGHRVLLLIGDAGGDFHADLGGHPTGQRNARAASWADHWGRRWIVLPNPMYGDWLTTLHGQRFDLTPEERRATLLAQLLSAPADPPSSGDDGSAVARSTAPVTGPSAPAPGTGWAGHELLAAGPMATWAEMTSAGVWVQTRRPARVQLRHWPAGRPGRARLTPTVITDTDGDHIATFVLDDLTPGARQEYELYLDGERVAVPWPLAVGARPLWQWRGEPHAPHDLTFLVGSCAYVNEPRFDRPGAPYGGGYPIFESMADEDAAFLLWLGDNTYLREVDWLTEEGMRHRYAHTRALPELQRLLGSMHHLAIWDDHDYGPDNADRSFRLGATARRVFADYWPDPLLGEGHGDSIHRRVEWGDVELFLLDDRSARAPAGGDVMLGDAQLGWLVDALRSSGATFKLVVNGGQLLNPDTGGESWNRFPAERRAFLDALAERAVPGVVLLSGDRHQSELMRLPRDGTYDLWEFSCSPLTAGVASAAYKSHNPLRVPDTWVGERNYGRIAVTGPHGARQLTLECLAADGTTRWSHVLTQAELGHD